jgi:rRNA-processing protein FCF1
MNLTRIILDTNAIMAIYEFKIDIFSLISDSIQIPTKIYVLSGIVDELEQIMKEQKGKSKLAARLGLSILKQKKISVLSSSNHVDDTLATMSANGDLILTQDIALKKRLTKPYLTIRQKNKIILIE